MATTEVQIANSALRKVGGGRIASLDEDSEPARLIKDAFPLLRDEVQRSHPWNFCIDRIELALLASVPKSGFSQEYQIPVDVLRVLMISDGTIGDTPHHTNRVAIHPWAKEGDKVLADLNPVIATVVKRIETVALWDANFVEALALRIAADIAYALAQSTTLQQAMFQAYEAFLRTARSFDAQEGSVQQVTASEWLDARG